MKITNFEHSGLDRVSKWIEKNKIVKIDEKSFKEVLKTINISFVLNNIDRIQSTLICELKNSYVQQSQRYVTMKDDSYILPELDKNDNLEARQITQEAFSLYGEMSQLKMGNFKGRPKRENYKYGIPIEDARYILPLSTKTNISMAMSGDRLYEFFYLINDRNFLNIFNELKKELYELIPENIINLLPSLYDAEDEKIIEDFYSEYLNRIDEKNNMILLDIFDDIELKVGIGALTSTQAKTPSEILAAWGEIASEKSRGVVERVLGYGHDSIAEQARMTFGMMCSMVTYHQQIRHRLSENHRESLFNIIKDKEREIVIPQTIKDSIFHEKFLKLVEKFKNFRIYISEKYCNEKSISFLLNCDQIKLIISTNSRIDIKMLEDRICMNAQWEIRELSTKKMMILRNLSKTLYKKALPSCIHGKCKEGKFSCGKQKEMREKFL